MPEEYKLSVVIPAYKEEKRLLKSLSAIKKYQMSHDFAIETIVVVDGSPDQTGETARKYQPELKNLKVIDRKENKGKG